MVYATSLHGALLLSILGKISADDIKIFFLFFQKTGFDILCKLFQMETMCMKCQILFSGKNKKKYWFVFCWIIP